jgi:hypothetical protein
MNLRFSDILVFDQAEGITDKGVAILVKTAYNFNKT